MHEYAVTKSIIDIVLGEAKKVKVNSVKEIRLVIGDLSTVIDESVQLYFDILTEGTILEGTKLIFKRQKAIFKCKECECKYEKPKIGFDCPSCGNYGIPTGEGKEFFIESIEI